MLKTQYKIHGLQTCEIVLEEYEIGIYFQNLSTLFPWWYTFYVDAEFPSSKTRSLFLNLYESTVPLIAFLETFFLIPPNEI